MPGFVSGTLPLHLLLLIARVNQGSSNSNSNDFCIDSSTPCGESAFQNHDPEGEGGIDPTPTEKESPAAKYQESRKDWTFILEKIKKTQLDYASDEKAGRVCGKDSECTCGFEELISKDLHSFSSGISRDLIDNAAHMGSLYQIRNHQLYRDPDCKFPARCSGVEHFLLKIVKDLDDMEIVINVSDWPQVHETRTALPVFSFSKTPDYKDIMYPAWTFWEGGPAIKIYPRGIGRWGSFRKSLKSAALRFPWAEKKPLGFFRGSRTTGERDPLILLSRDNPGLVDAQYTKNQAWKSDADTLGAPAAQEVTFEDHCRYKYLFNYRGVAASFRFKHLFLCKSLVFHVGDKWTEFFYPFLKPWVHYVPVDQNSGKEELKSLLEFAIHHDELVQGIADKGFELIDSRLKMSHVSCYWKKLLQLYSKLITYTVQPRPGFILIS